MRLTRFNNLTKEYEYRLDNPNTSMVQDEIAGTNKLGQLEDIEEKLGIDLITFFRALKDGIYVKYIDNTIGFDDDLEFNYGYYADENTPKTYYLAGDMIYLFLEYGKTWALTREELE